MIGALAGIGAATLVYSILSAGASELWFDHVLVFRSGPPRFELVLLPAYVGGAFVAFRLAHWRGMLWLTAFAALGVVRTLLAGWIMPNIELARHGLPSRPPDFDFVTPQAWAFVGIAIGTALAAPRRGTIPLRGALEAAGVYGIGIAIWGLVATSWSLFICYSPDGIARCIDTENILYVLWSVLTGLVAGLFFARRASVFGLIVLSLGLPLSAIDTLTHQGGMAWRDGPTFLLAMAANLVGVIAILVGRTIPASRGPRSSGAARRITG